MTRTTIEKVQEFLTVVSDDKVYRIVDVTRLLRRHPPEAVVALLIELRRDYNRELKSVLKTNRTNARVNEIVAIKFRIKMAINIIRNSKRRPING